MMTLVTNRRMGELPRDIDPVFSEVDLVQSICRESFYEFVKEFWSVLIPEEPVWNWHIRYICEELQHIAELVMQRKPKEHDEIINIPPGTTKSTICSILFHPWVWTRMPEARFIAASYEQMLALNFARRSRDVIESEKYQATFKFKKNAKEKWVPSMDKDAVSIELKDDQNAKGFYENSMQGDRKSVGAGGHITGSHAHFIVVDDPLNPKEAVSELGLKTINRWMDETLPSRKVDKAVTPTILIMQRLHQDDPTGHWLAKDRGKLKHVCLPAELINAEGKENVVKPLRLKRKYVDGLLDPVRLSRDVLKEQRADLGEFGYAGQYDQSPIPLGGGMFKVDMVNLADRPNPIEFVDTVRYWDKAGTKDAGANTAGVKMGKTRANTYWFLDCIAGQWRPDERERHIKQAALNDGDIVTWIEQEPGSGGKESAETTIISTLPGHRAKLDRPTGDKVTRAEPLAGQVNIGNVYAPKDAAWWPALREELQFFPYGKKKDRVDASSGAFNKLAGARMRAGAL